MDIIDFIHELREVNNLAKYSDYLNSKCKSKLTLTTGEVFLVDDLDNPSLHGINLRYKLNPGYHATIYITQVYETTDLGYKIPTNRYQFGFDCKFEYMHIKSWYKTVNTTEDITVDVNKVINTVQQFINETNYGYEVPVNNLHFIKVLDTVDLVEALSDGLYIFVEDGFPELASVKDHVCYRLCDNGCILDISLCDYFAKVSDNFTFDF